MAHEITELTRSVAPSADYPWGDLKDNPNGTLANRMMFTDMMQTMQKLMDLAGITPNGSDDNTSNGYQLIQALADFNTLSVAGGEWVAGGSVGFLANNDPVGSYTGITYTYNKYKLFGKTLIWQLSVSGTIAGSPTSFVISPPAALAADSVDWSANGFKTIGLYNNTATLLQSLGGAFAPGEITVSLVGGGAFTNAGSQTMNIYVIGEVFLNP